MSALAKSIAEVERIAGDISNWAAANSNWDSILEAQHMFNVAAAAKDSLPKEKNVNVYVTYFVNASPANRSAAGVPQLCAVPHRSKDEAEAHGKALADSGFKCVHVFGPVLAAEPV